MLRLPGFLRQSGHSLRRISTRLSPLRLSAVAGDGWSEEEEELGEFLGFMERLRNHERSGVPRGAGTDSDDGFDLGRVRRLLRRLGDPHTHFQAVHIAGTKGKGSTASFLSNILRDEGYKVGCYTSPHLLTIRERISIGRSGGPVSAGLLRDLFDQVKGILDRSIESENGALTHFEVFTALSFLLFSQENVDIAVIEAGLGGARDATNVIQSTELAASVITSIGKEHLAALGGSLESIAVAKSGIIKQERPVVIGGPFLPHIEQIIRDRAFLTKSPVISACDPGIQSILKCIGWDNGKPFQSCDVIIKIHGEMPLFTELHDVKLHLLGHHQLQNAVTASCTALCLRNFGWNISDVSIRAGLEKTQLPGRSQFLTRKEASALGSDGLHTILIDGAHTEASAKALSDVMKIVKPQGLLALVVGMATDKDHLAFAGQFLSGRRPDVVLLTEASIAGGKTRTMPASSLKETWISVAEDRGIDYVDIGRITDGEDSKQIDGLTKPSSSDGSMLVGCQDGPISDVIRVSSHLLQGRGGARPGLICVTGSLHIVSSVLQLLEQ